MSEKVFTHKVVTTTGGTVSQHESDAAATSDAANRNKEAEALGIKTRYEVKPIG